MSGDTGVGAAAPCEVVHITNLFDTDEVDRGLRDRSDIRTAEVHDARVDCNAMLLGLPPSLIERLGLPRWPKPVVQVAEGFVYGPVRLEIADRDCLMEVVPIAEGERVRIGRIALTLMDWVVDPNTNRLMGNPAYGGKWILELY